MSIGLPITRRKPPDAGRSVALLNSKSALCYRLMVRVGPDTLALAVLIRGSNESAAPRLHSSQQSVNEPVNDQRVATDPD